MMDDSLISIFGKEVEYTLKLRTCKHLFISLEYTLKLRPCKHLFISLAVQMNSSSLKFAYIRHFTPLSE